jgi:hypothetical protein
MKVPDAFNLPLLHLLIERDRPLSIEMTDKQYAQYTNLIKTNKRDVEGVPIVFVDAPKV